VNFRVSPAKLGTGWHPNKRITAVAMFWGTSTNMLGSLVVVVCRQCMAKMVAECTILNMPER